MSIVPANDGTVMSASDVARLEKERRAFYASMNKVVGFDKATSKVSSSEITVALIVLGASKVSPEGYSKMVYCYFPDQRLFKKSVKMLVDINPQSGLPEVIVDARSKAQREKDSADKKFDLDKTPILNQGDVEGMLDPQGNVRQVRVTLKPKLMSFRNDKIHAIPICALIVANVEMAAWHDEHTNAVVFSPKLKSVVDRIVFPERTLLSVLYRMNLWTKKYQTKVATFAEQLSKFRTEGKLEKDMPANERYRNDNEFIMPVGFGDINLDELSGCFFIDKTDMTEQENLYDTRNFKVRYLATYQGRQWEVNSKGERIFTNFVVDIAYFDNIMEQFGITSMQNWKILWPIIAPHMKALVLACEDAKRSYDIELNRERLNTTNVGGINGPASDNGISFAIGTCVRSIIFDPVDIISSITIPISADTLVKTLWNGNTRSPTIPQGVKPQKEGSLMKNLSESNEDHGHLLKQPNVQYRVLVNVSIVDRQGNAVPLSVFKSLSTIQGDVLFKYLDACVIAGPGANISKSEYLETLQDMNPDEFATIDESHPIHQYIFSASPMAGVVLNVYAIQMDLIDRERQRFDDSLKRLNMGDIFVAPTPLLTQAPAAVAAVVKKRKHETSVSSVDDAPVEEGKRTKRNHRPQPKKTSAKKAAPESDDADVIMAEGDDDDDDGNVVI